MKRERETQREIDARYNNKRVMKYILPLLTE